MVADRFSPSKVFFISAVLGAFFNVLTIWDGNGFVSLLSFRFLTGFFLAGIYPVGMKIAADYFDKGLGKSLGLLVGALVLGTAFPHLIKDLFSDLPWKIVLLTTSALAILGGILMVVLVPNGPYRKPSQKIDFSVITKIFKNRQFRSAAFGYFGHMWELYTFWAFVPMLLTSYVSLHPSIEFNIPILSFCIIGIGATACVIGSHIADCLGTKKTALMMLFLSGLCCLVSPLFFLLSSPSLFIAFLLFWGMVVIADSPLFSTLVAQNAPSENKGTALTIVTCIGFALTIVSIQGISYLVEIMNPTYIYMLLAIGPIWGLLANRDKRIISSQE